MDTCIYPYTYLIGWSQHDRWYYGVRYAKGCHPSELWTNYFTSSKYVKMYRDMYGEPDVIEVRRTFSDTMKAMEWENRVLRRMKVVEDVRWINATTNAAPHKSVRKHNPIPGALGAKKKLSGRTYEELYGTEKAIELKKKRRETLARNWSDPSIKARMIKKPLDTSAYRIAAIKRHSNPERKRQHSEALKEWWRKRKEAS